MSSIDKLYISLIENIIENGEWEKTINRTGIQTKFIIGNYWEIPVNEYFPIIQSKKVAWRSAIAEMVCFIRGYSNAADFRRMGCKVWDQNANENQKWLNNPFRLGTDDLGRVYGVQWRNWQNPIGENYDQFKKVIDDLSNGIDDRREIVTSWNPGELNQMALPPCHFTMIFSLRDSGETVDLFMSQRSVDCGLGLPFNLVQYGFLLNLVAKITNKKVGVFRYYMNNVHVYANHIDKLYSQINEYYSNERYYELNKPQMFFNSVFCDSLNFVETTDQPIKNWCRLVDYAPTNQIKMEMAV